MTLVQLDGGAREPVAVIMDAVVHPVPAGTELPESHFICTKVHDDSGPSEYTLHLYIHEGVKDRHK